MTNATLSIRLVLLLSGAFTLSWAATAAAQDDETTEADAAPAAADDDTDTDEAQTEDADGDDSTVGDEPSADDAASDDTAASDAAASDAAASDAAAETAPDEQAASDSLEAPAAETTEAEGGSDLAAPDDSALEEGDLAAEEAAAEDAEAEDAPAAPEPLPWRSTFFTWTHGVTFNTFVRDGQLSYNPTYLQRFSLSPRWYVAPTSFFWANVALDLEVTDADSGPLNREPQLFDTSLEFRHMMPWEGFIFIGQMRLMFPTSKSSQAAQRYFQTGLGLTAVRPVPEIGLTIAAVLAYRRWWAGSNVVQVGEPQPDNCAPLSPVATGGMGAPNVSTTTCDQLGTPSAARDIFLGGLALTWVPFAGFNISASGFIFTTYSFELADYVDTEGRVITRPENDPLVLEDGSRSHWNNFTFVSLSMGYQFFPWLNISVGVQNSIFLGSAWNPDGSVRNPFFNPDMQAFLSATFTVDELYNGIFGAGESDLTPEERQRRQQGLASGPSATGSF